jgi:hypothetical protein
MKELEVLGSTLVLRAMDTIAILFAQAYLLARQRLTDHASPVVRLMAMTDKPSSVQARLGGA